ARQRLYAGAEMGIDTEGWLVEIWLARPEPGIEEALARAEPKVGEAMPMGIVPVEGEAGGSTATVRFAGDGAHAFFERDGREHFVGLAERLVVATSAARGALYARCAHLDVQDVGAWYFGRDDGAVVAALSLTAGAHAEGS